MLCENIRSYRKAKGLSQEELATKVNVVRQTVSKWEKGISVPDSEMLIALADALGVSVSALLGEEAQTEEAPTLQALAAKLELLNEQFAKRAERSRKIWRWVFGAVGCVSAVALLCTIVPLVYCLLDANATLGSNGSIGIIGGADGPTAIFVSSTLVNVPSLILSVLLLAAAAVGFYKTK